MTSSPQSYFGLQIPFLDVLGIEAEFAKDGHSRIRLQLRPELLNSFHVAHGGVVMSILDFAMAAAARSAHQHVLGVITIDMTTSFIRASRGLLIAEGRVLKAGNTINYCEASVFDETGELTAKASGSFMLNRGKPSPNK
ncbi:MAG: PaaI family thioesterase [Polynucleobacter sp.]|nr:PaaI family thioesterase [Polynucleobacter sp.]